MKKLFLLTGFILAACSTSKPVLNIRSAQTLKSDFPPGGAPDSNVQGNHYLLGKWYLATGNIALALENFRKELRENPNSIDARNGLAVAYDRLGRFDLSQRYYEEALAIQPENKMLLSNLDYSLSMQGKKQNTHEIPQTAENSTSEPIEPVVVRNDKLSPSISPEGTRITATVSFDDKIQPHPDQWLERTSPHMVQLVTLKPSDSLRPWLTNVTRDRKLPPVFVLNAARRQGIAARFSAEVHNKGWSAGGVGNSKYRSAKSKLFYDPAMGKEALQLAWSLSILPVMHARPGVKGLVLYIGRDAISVDTKIHFADAKMHLKDNNV